MANEYVIIVDTEKSYTDFDEAILNTVAIAGVFTKAYKTACSMADIVSPSIGYRRALAIIRAKGVVRIEDTAGPNKFLITYVKKY